MLYRKIQTSHTHTHARTHAHTHTQRQVPLLMWLSDYDNVGALAIYITRHTHSVNASCSIARHCHTFEGHLTTLIKHSECIIRVR